MPFDFKNANQKELKEEYKRIAKNIGDDGFFTRKELNHLPKILSDNEYIEAFTSGYMDGHTWLVTLTNKRIIFLNKGLIYGLKQTTIDLEKINSITGQTGLILGKIKIEDSARQREIDNVPKRTVIKFTNMTRDAINASKDGQNQVAPAHDDPLSKLERLASLKERGMITDEEYSLQKTKIMEM